MRYIAFLVLFVSSFANAGVITGGAKAVKDLSIAGKKIVVDAEQGLQAAALDLGVGVAGDVKTALVVSTYPARHPRKTGKALKATARATGKALKASASAAAKI